MKVEFENGVSSYSGKYKEVVYQAWFDGQLCYARRNFYPTLGTVHAVLRQVAANLNSLYLAADEAYRQDLCTYARKNYTQNRPSQKALMHKMPTAKSLFIRCMWLWSKSEEGHVDLKTITISDMVTLGSPACKVSTCVTAGYLQRVSGYESLDNSIQS